MCIAADSGLDHAYDLGLRPEVVVGDLDSVSAGALARAEREGTEIDRHPARKAKTDLELALDRAMAVVPDRIVVAGIGGGRLDHHLANLLLLADERFTGPDVDALVGTSWIGVVRSRMRTLRGSPDELVSLLPVHGNASGVTATGLGYPLAGAELAAGSTRGVSNYFEGFVATVVVTRGTLLAVQPDGLQTAQPDGLQTARPDGLGGSDLGGNEGGTVEE